MSENLSKIGVSKCFSTCRRIGKAGILYPYHINGRNPDANNYPVLPRPFVRITPLRINYKSDTPNFTDFPGMVGNRPQPTFRPAWQRRERRAVSYAGANSASRVSNSKTLNPVKARNWCGLRRSLATVIMTQLYPIVHRVFRVWFVLRNFFEMVKIMSARGTESYFCPSGHYSFYKEFKTRATDRRWR